MRSWWKFCRDYREVNITIDKYLHDYLQSIVCESIVFGSRATQDHKEDSDTDYMHIVKCHKALATCPVYAGHWLQYKEVDDNGIVIADHIYSTVPQFIHGVINAESMIPWEILYTRYSIGESILQMRNYNVLNNFKSARGFLGLARRDLKDSTKLFNSDLKKSKKKLQFAIRSYEYAYAIINKFHTLETINTNVFDDTLFTSYRQYIEVVKYVEKLVDSLRDILIDLHNKKIIPYTVDTDVVVQLHKDFLQDIILLKDNQYSTKMLQLYAKAAIENEYK